MEEQHVYRVCLRAHITEQTSFGRYNSWTYGNLVDAVNTMESRQHDCPRAEVFVAKISLETQAYLYCESEAAWNVLKLFECERGSLEQPGAPVYGTKGFWDAYNLSLKEGAQPTWIDGVGDEFYSILCVEELESVSIRAWNSALQHEEAVERHGQGRLTMCPQKLDEAAKTPAPVAACGDPSAVRDAQAMQQPKVAAERTPFDSFRNSGFIVESDNGQGFDKASAGMFGRLANLEPRGF